jgi:malic enzyme
MTLMKEALELHRTHRGKIEVISKVPVLNKHDLSLAYTPGVAEPCKEIHADHVDFALINCGNTRASCISLGMAHKERNISARLA